MANGEPRVRFESWRLINAVTATARETRDPELRWKLEEFGGGMPATLPQKTPRRPTPACAPVRAPRERVLSGA